MDIAASADKPSIPEAIHRGAPFTVHGLWPVSVSDCWAQEVAGAAYDAFLDAWDDHYGYSDVDFPHGSRDAARAQVRELIAEWARKTPTRVYRPVPDELRVYSADEAEAILREAMPSWFADQPEVDARELFVRWLQAHGVQQRTAAKVLGVTEATVSGWIRGRRMPEPAFRTAIERWSAGAVPALAWQSPQDRELQARLASIRPLQGVSS
jgi:hypothetical protein